MNTEEVALREIADSYLKGTKTLTQAGVSKTSGISVSAVNRLAKELNSLSIIDVGRREFKIMDFERLLVFWATHRRLQRDIVYSTRVDMDIGKIEGSMPVGIAFTAFTDYKLIVGEPPADYSEVYVYSTEKALDTIIGRFPPKKGIKNLFIIKTDRRLAGMIERKELKKDCVGIPQMFVDLWNIRAWYAREFTNRLIYRLRENGILE